MRTPVSLFLLAFWGMAQAQTIKALSPDDIQSYLTGKGMGLAKAAELNGYPGPSHTLTLASQLHLTPTQQAQTQDLFATMEKNAITAGRSLIDEERKLDYLFASKAITPTLLTETLGRIAERQAQVRVIHLETHLGQARILTPAQVALYMQLRGYTAQDRHHQHTSEAAP